MDILMLVLFGFVVGVIAKLLMPGRDPGGFIITILLGIAGSVIGNYVGKMLGVVGRSESAGWLVTISGAILLLLIYRIFVGNRTR